MAKLSRRLYSWILTFDPGLTRLEKAGLSLVSFLSSWIIIRGILAYFGSTMSSSVKMSLVLFSSIFSLVLSLIVIDLRPADRRTTFSSRHFSSPHEGSGKLTRSTLECCITR